MKITNDVRQVLEKGISIDGNALKITRQLDRVLYIKIAALLKALGAVWDRKSQSHLGPDDLAGRIERALIVGFVTTDRDLGFFWTPSAIAERMADFVTTKRPNPAPTDKMRDAILPYVLEPSAGNGMLVDAILRRGGKVVAIEWDKERRRLLAERHNVIVPRRDDETVDFLDFYPNAMFEGIIANPPFARVGRGDHVDHLNHMLNILAPTGRLACVMPASLCFREDRRYMELRKRIGLMHGRIERLRDGSFKESGTMVNTCLVYVG